MTSPEPPDLEQPDGEPLTAAEPSAQPPVASAADASPDADPGAPGDAVASADAVAPASADALPQTRAARRAAGTALGAAGVRRGPRRSGHRGSHVSAVSHAGGRGRGAHPAPARSPMLLAARVSVATIVTAALLAALGYAGDAAPASGPLANQVLLAAGVAWAGLVLAWAWPALHGSPSRFGSSLAIAVSAVGSAVAVWRTDEDAYLTYVPVALAVALLVMFLHQLLRRDGRARLTQSIAVTSAGIAIAAIGSCYVALARFDGGVALLGVALVAVAAGSLVDLLQPVEPLRPWLLPLGMVVGGLAAAALAGIQGDPATARAVLVGFVVAAVSHALRRVLAPLPAIGTLRGQLASATASVLLGGVVAYALAWIFLR